jgi:hypothetical protein
MAQVKDPRWGPQARQCQPVSRFGFLCRWNALVQPGQIAIHFLGGMSASPQRTGLHPTQLAIARQTGPCPWPGPTNAWAIS